MIKDIILAVIAVLGPIISGIWSYKSSVKKSEVELESVREKYKSEIESVRIQSENELEKIREQALAESKLHEDKTKTDLIAKQFENPVVQEMMGNLLGPVMEQAMKDGMKQHFNKDNK